MITRKNLAIAVAAVLLVACDSGVEIAGPPDTAVAPTQDAPSTPSAPPVNVSTTAGVNATPAFIQRGCGTGNSEQVYCPD